ncbi:MAG: hypothetical protein NT151_07570 [Acidobacteria bacterium]|nr:hypothetical protein [Acidobacteriota bacterium]
MTLDHWLESACADADRRGLPDLKPLLTTLAQATRVLRAADWNDLVGAVRQQTDDGRLGATARPPQGAGQ